jgi:hypothetical protein
MSKQKERPAHLTFWFQDGFCGGYHARVAASTTVSIGRTDSKRALGFVVRNGQAHFDFVLNRDQVEELAAYLQLMHPALLGPLGPERPQLSITVVAAIAAKTKKARARRKATNEKAPGSERREPGA